MAEIQDSDFLRILRESPVVTPAEITVKRGMARILSALRDGDGEGGDGEEGRNRRRRRIGGQCHHKLIERFPVALDLDAATMAQWPQDLFAKAARLVWERSADRRVPNPAGLSHLYRR